MLISPFYTWGNGGSKRLQDFPISIRWVEPRSLGLSVVFFPLEQCFSSNLLDFCCKIICPWPPATAFCFPTSKMLLNAYEVVPRYGLWEKVYNKFPSIDNETYNKQRKKSCTVLAFDLPCCVLVYPVREVEIILGISNRGNLIQGIDLKHADSCTSRRRKWLDLQKWKGLRSRSC